MENAAKLAKLESLALQEHALWSVPQTRPSVVPPVSTPKPITATVATVGHSAPLESSVWLACALVPPERKTAVALALTSWPIETTAAHVETLAKQVKSAAKANVNCPALQRRRIVVDLVSTPRPTANIVVPVVPNVPTEKYVPVAVALVPQARQTAMERASTFKRTTPTAAAVAPSAQEGKVVALVLVSVLQVRRTAMELVSTFKLMSAIAVHVAKHVHQARRVPTVNVRLSVNQAKPNATTSASTFNPTAATAEAVEQSVSLGALVVLECALVLYC